MTCAVPAAWRKVVFPPLLDNIILFNNMDEIYSKTIVRLCDFASKLNSTIVNAFKAIYFY